jgi:hypothetical protein
MIRLFVMALLVLSGCAGVVSIQHPMIVTNHTCEFDIGRAGKWPWDPSQCLTACRDDKEISYFPGCSSEGGVLSGIKAASGIVPTVPIAGY